MSQKLMIPQLLAGIFANPGVYEEQIYAFLEAQEYECDKVAKTLGTMELYHYLPVANLPSVNFFAGDFSQTRSNLPGTSFIRPKGEHMIIWGFRIEEAADVAAVELTGLDWTPGAQSPWAKNSNLSVKVNGVDRLLNVPLVSSQENLTTADNGIMILAEPIIWGGEIAMIVNVSSRLASQVGQASGWMKVTALGVGLFS
jgi:hypothetical protein